VQAGGGHRRSLSLNGVEAYARYGPALIRKCQRLLQNSQDSEDIVQGLFVDLLSQGAPAEVLDLPYLYRAVTNRCLNHLRDARNRTRLLAEHDGSLRGPARVACDEQVLGLELVLRLAEKLDPACFEVLAYRYFDELTLEEIAELIGTSRKTVGKRLERVREAVRRLLGRGGGA